MDLRSQLVDRRDQLEVRAASLEEQLREVITKICDLQDQIVALEDHRRTVHKAASTN